MSSLGDIFSLIHDSMPSRCDLCPGFKILKKKTSAKNPLFGDPESHQSEFENGMNTVVCLQLFMALFENNKTKLLYCYTKIVKVISLFFSYLCQYICYWLFFLLCMAPNIGVHGRCSR